MRRKVTCLALMSVSVAVVALYHAGSVLGTPANGFTGTTLAKGRFGEIDVFNHLIQTSAQDEEERTIWLSLQRTKGSSDLFVQSNVWQPKGSTGWHRHPGHSLIIVTAGTLTNYEGDDPECKPHVYTEGMGFVDRGGEHAHLVRNEGTVEAHAIAVQLIPADALRRTEAAEPSSCHL